MDCGPFLRFTGVVYGLKIQLIPEMKDRRANGPDQADKSYAMKHKLEVSREFFDLPYVNDATFCIPLWQGDRHIDYA